MEVTYPVEEHLWRLPTQWKNTYGGYLPSGRTHMEVTYPVERGCSVQRPPAGVSRPVRSIQASSSSLYPAAATG